MGAALLEMTNVHIVDAPPVETQAPDQEQSDESAPLHPLIFDSLPYEIAAVAERLTAACCHDWC